LSLTTQENGTGVHLRARVHNKREENRILNFAIANIECLRKVT